MNLFILDYSIDTSVSYYCDQHVSKTMFDLEDLLAYVHCVIDGTEKRIPIIKKNGSLSYMTTYDHHNKHISSCGLNVNIKNIDVRNHPLFKWTCECMENYQFVYEYLRHLAQEYRVRFGNTNFPLSTRIMLGILVTYPVGLESNGWTGPKTMYVPMRYRQNLLKENLVQRCQRFYKEKNAHMKMTWTNVPKPTWI